MEAQSAIPVSEDESVDPRAIRCQVERRLRYWLPPESRPLAQCMREIVVAPGKRMRPVLTVLVGRGLNCRSPGLLDAACAIEMVHAASLVLDDLPCMDDATVRRGLPAAHLQFGEATVILAAVALLSRAFGILASEHLFPPHVGNQLVSMLAETVGTDGLAGGQYDDLVSGLDGLSLRQISTINRRKTGALFVAAVAMGATIAGVRDGRLDRLCCFAASLGHTYQQIDDFLDRAEVSDLTGEDGQGDDRPRSKAIAGQAQEGATARLRKDIVETLELARGGPCALILEDFLRVFFKTQLANCADFPMGFLDAMARVGPNASHWCPPSFT
jgi:geranylgeranyl diphosphate synthase type II